MLRLESDETKFYKFKQMKKKTVKCSLLLGTSNWLQRYSPLHLLS